MGETLDPIGTDLRLESGVFIGFEAGLLGLNAAR